MHEPQIIKTKEKCSEQSVISKEIFNQVSYKHLASCCLGKEDDEEEGGSGRLSF